MNPAELDAWWAWFKAKLPSRSHVLWRLMTIAGLALYVVQHKALWPPGFTLSQEWVTWFGEIAFWLGISGAKMGSSLSTKPPSQPPQP